MRRCYLSPGTPGGNVVWLGGTEERLDLPKQVLAAVTPRGLVFAPLVCGVSDALGMLTSAIHVFARVGSPEFHGCIICALWRSVKRRLLPRNQGVVLRHSYTACYKMYEHTTLHNSMAFSPGCALAKL